MRLPKRVGVALVAVGLVAGVTVGAGTALAAPSSSDPGEAGPDLLRAGAVDAPQLQNTGIWQADPIGVCMTSAYRAGEYVHQGCVYDDEGGGNQYRWPNDTVLRNYTYPEDPAYRRNAADIVEVRAKPHGRRDRVPGHDELDDRPVAARADARTGRVGRRPARGPVRREHGHAGGQRS